jgi:hypothetical protein
MVQTKWTMSLRALRRICRKTPVYAAAYGSDEMDNFFWRVLGGYAGKTPFRRPLMVQTNSSNFWS